MSRYCILKGVPPKYSHHDFNEMIGKALLDPDNHWPTCYRLHSNDTQSRTPSPVQAAANIKKAPKFTDTSLHHIDGKLRCRLIPLLPHVCVPIEKKSMRTCQLHRWAYRKHLEKSGLAGDPTDVPPGGRKCVVSCHCCVVRLCAHCWEIFHFSDDLESRIPDILANK